MVCADAGQGGKGFEVKTRKGKSKTRLLIAACPEFELWSETDGTETVHCSSEVEDAMWKAAMRITDANEGSEKRLRFSQALLALAEYTAKQRTAEGVLDQIAGTLGEMILSGLDAPIQNLPISDQRHSALEIQFPGSNVAKVGNSSKETMRRAQSYAETVGAAVENAFQAIARWKIQPDGWKRGLKIQFCAKEIFRESRKRPTKSQIRERLEFEGEQIGGKNANALWREAFISAGLDTLPA